MIAFTVVGEPRTQGSKVARTANGKAWVAETGGQRHAIWRARLADAARAAHSGELLEGPVSVTLRFSFVRPASHPKKRVTFPIGARSGDVDKLARAVLDALTGTVLRDDSQVTELHVTKGWGDLPGVSVELEAQTS